MSKASRAKSGGSGKAGLIGTVSAAVLLAGGLIYWITRPSPEAILNAETLTPKQIHYVATDLIAHENMKIRARAGEKLVAIGAPAVPVLRDVCQNYKDNGVREAVLRILLTIDAGGSADLVAKLAADPNADIRRLAVASAGRLPEAQRGPILKQAVNDPEPAVRLAAMNCLAEAKSAQNVAVLNQALKDPNITVRRHAAHSLTVITGKDYTSQVQGP